VTRVLFLDLISGISGDMTLAALLHAGARHDYVRKQVALATPDRLDLGLVPVFVNGIAASRLTVRVDAASAHPPHDHAAIVALLDASGLDAPVRDTAKAIFLTLATAEAAVHGCDVGSVHFHEVGAWDSIADIVGTAAALHDLRIDTVVASRIPLGRGFVETRHGTMPVPAPATVEILKGVPVCGTDVEAELTTPTGAAIVKTLAASFGPMPDMELERVGWGAGHRTLPDRPNVLRAVLGLVRDAAAVGGEWLVETNIDDCSPEVLAHAQEALLAAGALDVWLTPVQMKKGRPGVVLSLLCDETSREILVRQVFCQTTAIGIRETRVQRRRLSRRTVVLDTSIGPIPFKVAMLDGRVVNRKPEFEAVRRAAEARGMPVKDAMALVLAALEQSQ